MQKIVLLCAYALVSPKLHAMAALRQQLCPAIIAPLIRSTTSSSIAHEIQRQTGELHRLRDGSSKQEALLSEAASKLGVSSLATIVSPLISTLGVEVIQRSVSMDPLLVSIPGLLIGTGFTIGGAVRTVRGVYETIHLVPQLIRRRIEWRHAAAQVETAQVQLQALQEKLIDRAKEK